MLRAVTVDWWHTLAEPDESERWEECAKRERCEGIQGALRAHGIDATYERIEVAYDLWTDHMKRVWKQHEDLDADAQVLELLACAGYDDVADRALVAAIHEPIGSPLVLHPPKIHEGAVETLRALKTRGLKLAIVSNTGRTWGRFLRRVQEKVGLGDVFDYRAFSDEVRVRKPAAGIFERTLHALALEPADVAHIGDDVDADVAGAKALGIRTVWFDTGLWKGADGSKADAVIHAWRELPAAIEGW